MLRPLVPFLVALALAGCDSDDGGPSGDDGAPGSAIDADGATLLGLVDIALLDDVDSGREPGVDAVYGSFRRFASTEELEAIVSLIRPAASDACLLREDDDFEGFDEASPIDAGEVLVFTSPDGTWVEMARTDGEEGVEYVEPGSPGDSIVLPDSVPAGLVLDVPGADFPAFAAVPVPAVTPLGEIAPGRFPPGAAVTDTFEWDAADDPGSVVRLDFLVASGNGADDELRDVTCVTRDDGAFAIPTATLAALGADEDTYFVVMVTRETRHVARRGDALLLTSQSSEGG